MRLKLPGKILSLLLPMTLLACAGAGLLYLRSDRFQEHVRQALTSRVEKATGLECRIGSLRVDVFRGRFLISGLTLSAPAGTPGLVKLAVQEISASLSLSSFWQFRIRLGELNVRQPRLELISSDKESSWDPEGILKALRISLRLEASRVRVQDGWIRMNGRTSPFQLSADDLDCEIRYSRKRPSYKVRLEYGKSEIFWEQRSIVHGLMVEADVSLDGVEIGALKFSRGDTVLSGSASVKDWKSPAALFDLHGILDAKDLVLAHESLYEGRGRIRVDAELRIDSRGVYSKGKFSAGKGGYRKMDFSSLAGIFEIKNNVLHLRDISGRIADGTFQVSAEIQLRQANTAPNDVLVITKSVPVIDAGRLLNLPLLDFSNTADARTKIVWYGGKEFRADCDGMLHGAGPDTASAKSTMLEGPIRFTYFESGRMEIQSAVLRSPYTTVQISGGLGSVFRAQLSTTRMTEPYDLIAAFSPPVADLAKREADVRTMAGEFGLDGEVKIQSSSDIEYKGKITVQNGRWRSFKVDTLSAQAFFHSPSLNLDALSIHSGTSSIGGALQLKMADDNSIASLQFTGNARRIRIEDIKGFGADTSKVSGSLSGSGSVKYCPGSWEGNGQFLIENGSYGGESFDLLRAQVSMDGRNLRITQAEAQRDTARISAQGQVNLDSRQIDMKTRLQNLALSRLPFILKKKLPVQGNIGVSGAVSGTLENPAFSGSFDIDAFRYDSRAFGPVKGQIAFKDSIVTADAAIRPDFGLLNVHASISTRAGNPGKTSLRFKDLNIQKLVPARKIPSYFKDLSTALEGTLDAEGDFEDPDSLKINGEVDGAHFKINEHELHNDERMRFTILRRNLRMESVRFVGQGTSLFLSGTVPFDDSPGLDLNLSGDLNLQLLEGFESRMHAAGTATLGIRARGSKRDPQIIGQASFRDAKLDYKDFPFRFSSMQGDIVFSRNLVRFENVRGSAASGSIQVSGFLEHQNAVLKSINLSIGLRNARLPYPKDFKSVSDANLVLSGSGDVQVLSGDIHVTRMEYVRSFDLLEQLASRSTTSTGPLTTEPYLLGLRLNIEIQTDNGLTIDNELTRLRGSMRLTLRGTPAYPSLTGRVEASEGTIFFRGSRFEISHASADFVDRNRINPVLEIRAEADVKTYRLILDAVGEWDHLNLNITSDPVMSTVDILSLLTTGKEDTGTGTSQRESQMAGMSAASVLSQNLTGVIGKRVQRIFGLESFRVDPFLAGAENDPTARVTISERISKDIVVTFSRNLSTNQEQIVVIEYDVGKNVSIVGTRDENGKFGLDFRFRKRLR